jgi:hypothetical protein
MLLLCLQFISVFIKVSLLPIYLITSITFEWLLVIMDSLNMSLKISCKAKTLLTNVASVLFHFFMDTFNVFSSISVIKSREHAQITICFPSCFHEPFEHVSSNFLQGQNSFDKCCIGVVSAFHGHTQCAFLDHCDAKKNTHTNHICIFSCFHEPFENAF